MRNVNPKSEGGGFTLQLRPIGFSVLFGILVTVGLLLILSFVISIRDVPQTLINPISLVTVAVGAFFSGYLCTRKTREKGLLYGLICGLIIFLLMMISSFAISDDGFGMLLLYKLIAILAAAMLGGVLGVNAKRKRK